MSKVILKTPEQIEKMLAAGRIVHEALRTAGSLVRPGVTTDDLDDAVAAVLCKHGATSPFLGYAPHGHPPYPAWTCISINEEIVHGIPSRRRLCQGDIVTVDCGAELNGWIADSAWTFPVGEVSADVTQLLKVAKEALYKGIEKARPGLHVGDIGCAVQQHAERHGYSVVRELSGHGVGRVLHEGLQIPNFGKPGQRERLVKGMTFAIEPMISMGRRTISQREDDKWTIETADRKLAAHFEHTVAITDGPPRILTNGD